MSHSTVKLTVYKNRANPVTLAIKQRVNGVQSDVDFSNVVRMVLTLNPNGSSPVEVDTDTDAEIDFSTNGQVVFTIGALAQVAAMAEGEYDARLTAVDGAGGKTELLNEDNPQTKVIFVLRDTTSI